MTHTKVNPEYLKILGWGEESISKFNEINRNSFTLNNSKGESKGTGGNIYLLQSEKTIHSIPSLYKGVKFRSKLEASWAKFFDRHGIKWMYEPEGFNMGGIKYLPDFYLHEIRTVVEVKGIMKGIDEEKLGKFARHAAESNIITILAQSIDDNIPEFYYICPTPRHLWDEECDDENFPLVGSADFVGMMLCPDCNRWYFQEYSILCGCTACGSLNHAKSHPTYNQVGRVWVDLGPQNRSCSICDFSIFEGQKYDHYIPGR